MRGLTVNLGAVAVVIVSLGASGAGAQQQVVVTVAAVPNPVPPGSCVRILTDVKNELNQQLTLPNGVPLQWSDYDYSASNSADFVWRNTASGEPELCAKPGVGAVNTGVTATIKGMTNSGTTLVSVAGQPGAPPANAGGVAPGGIASAPPPAGPQPAAAPATVPAQPYVPAPANAPPAQPTASQAQPYAPPAQPYAPPAQPYAPPAEPYAPPQSTATNPPPAGAAPPPAAAPPPPQQAQAQPVKSGGGFFKKIGSHIKQKAAEVKTETAQNLTAAATQVVDTTFQTGSRLVASTTAEVTNTARMGIGGVGRQLMLAPQRGGASADNLKLAIASGRAVLLEIRFTPGTSVLEPSARDLVQRLGAELRNAMATMPGVRFEINGHVVSPTDQVLSEDRAAAVKALLSNQVDAQRLTALGYGASQPLDGVPTARVEIVRCNDGQRACLMAVAP